MRELEFRANFFVKLLQNAVWLLFFVMLLVVVFNNTKSIAGWGERDSIVLIATVFVVNALHAGFFFSLTEIPQHVRQGTLDFILVRPMDSQFTISLRKFAFEQLGSFLSGLGLVIIGVNQSGHAPSPLQWMSYFVLVFSAVMIFYAFMLALMTLAIWLVRVDNLWVLGDSVMGITRFPIDIYPGGVRYFLIFGIPLGFISTMPTQQLVREFQPQYLALGVGWAILLLFLSRKFWLYAMRNYTSASS